MEAITKGYSADEKYRVTENGQEYLLRISPPERYEARKALFAQLEQAVALGIPMARPVELGLCPQGVYTLYAWVEGEEAEERIPLLPRQEQYRLGFKAGEILRKIHTLPAPEDQEDWAARFGRKMDGKIQKYRECPLRFEGDGQVLEFLGENRGLLTGRPQCFQHGDYHIANMLLAGGQPVILDFDRFDFGDPWEEFNRIVWCARASPAFATGRVEGYFGSKPPADFWPLLALYVASNLLSSIPWAIPFGQGEVEIMQNQARDVLGWYEGMRNPVPSWYREHSEG